MTRRRAWRVDRPGSIGGAPLDDFDWRELDSEIGSDIAASCSVGRDEARQAIHELIQKRRASHMRVAWAVVRAIIGIPPRTVDELYAGNRQRWVLWPPW